MGEDLELLNVLPPPPHHPPHLAESKQEKNFKKEVLETLARWFVLYLKDSCIFKYVV
jgi:hypothetical protein